MSRYHSAVVGRFIYKYLGIKIFRSQSLVEKPCEFCDFGVGGGRAFLFGTLPIPMSVGFVDGADVIDCNAVLFFETLDGFGNVIGKLSVTFGLQVQRASPTRVGGESVLSEIHRRRIEKRHESCNTSFLRLLHKVDLRLLLGKIPRTIRQQERFGARHWLYLGTIALKRTACTEIKPPDIQPNTLVVREEQIGGFRHGFRWPLVGGLYRPRIRRPKTVDSLKLLTFIYFNALSERCATRCRQQQQWKYIQFFHSIFNIIKTQSPLR